MYHQYNSIERERVSRTLWRPHFYDVFCVFSYFYMYFLFSYIHAYIHIWGQVKIGGPEQAPGPHPFHTPVPYLLEGSVPYLCSIPLFHTSVPYLCFIPLFHTSDPYVIIYNYI